ncbi:hypothetical protein BO99DRAFT_406702 [Aspergillus violaceofuscus CBS 115571]|uniref:Secreted protein n=1 Tax=Aspergillus violaceofuscus (strain CBS 115571) TaxID=1450538 RepID=A0A2V5GT06_ASPV1|nr:hypothetical protein BO99DRAFT_406702 [Aspergillus violaceofuscus CBS 115571]
MANFVHTLDLFLLISSARVRGCNEQFHPSESFSSKQETQLADPGSLMCLYVLSLTRLESGEGKERLSWFVV